MTFWEYYQKSKDILGIDARNLLYVRPFNHKKGIEIADNKLKTKDILHKKNIPTPKLIAKIKNYKELDEFDWNSLPDTFVLKPNRGFAGGGILVAFSRKKNVHNIWIKSDGSEITEKDLQKRITDILDGVFSLYGGSDVAFFEERITLIKEFKPYSFRGIPDIRIILHKNVPIMAMVRFPTKKSGGAANLQQGAVGVGIDMHNGTTTTAIYGKNKIIEKAPDSKMLLSGIKIPHWNEILTMAVDAQITSGLGYLGVDIAIDRKHGPMFLELNARPGLSIQIANQDGLQGRLNRIKGLNIKTTIRGVNIGKSLFGGEIEEILENISGKSIIGRIENITIFKNENYKKNIQAKIDTGAFLTSIDESLAEELGFSNLIREFSKIDFSKYGKINKKNTGISKKIMQDIGKEIQDLENITISWSSHGFSIRPIVNIKILLDNKTIHSRATIGRRKNLNFQVLIGRKDLQHFLVDVTKTLTKKEKII